MSSREPLWFCHQCHAEMRPLMTPDPICASCRGDFVERLEDPSDDPRDFQHRAQDPFEPTDDLPGAFQGLFRPASSRSPDNSATRSTSPRARSPPTRRTQDDSSSTGLRFEFHSGPGGTTSRTFILGGPNTLGRSPQPDQSLPTIFDFLRREGEDSDNMHAHGDITGPLMAQYLLTLFGRDPHARGDPLGEILGMPQSARWGDYVFNQEALDQILTQLAENSTGARPVPATEEIIDDLPRQVLMEGSPLLESDCAVCKESFKLNPDDPDELVIVTLPCKHPFHEGCILPWLKSSGTCPVCRFALIAQPQQPPPEGPSGGSSNFDPTRPSSGSRARSPGNSDSRGVGGSFFHSLFRGGAGSSGGTSDPYSTRSQRNLGRGDPNANPEVCRTPSFPGRWIEDID